MTLGLFIAPRFHWRRAKQALLDYKSKAFRSDPIRFSGVKKQSVSNNIFMRKNVLDTNIENAGEIFYRFRLHFLNAMPFGSYEYNISGNTPVPQAFRIDCHPALMGQT